MKSLFHSRRMYVGIAILLIGLAILLLMRTLSNKTPAWVTATVSRGEIVNLVSVSGVVAAQNTAELAFPTTGTIASVLVDEGDMVTEGQLLVTLEQSGLQAERRDALAALLIAQANRDELLSGPRTEERDITRASVAIAEENLARTIAEEAEKVENARRTLLSANLEALPEKKDNNDQAPTISGTHTCQEEGSYTFSIFRSGARSGYSYRLSGLETGTYTAYTESPAPLGTCGLSIQFADGESYAGQDWTVTIPNTRSSSHAANLNAYELALQKQSNNVEAKEQALDLALREQILENASPRDEALQRANANVLQAEAKLAVVDARIKDRTLSAPFNGIVNNVDVILGESVGTTPIMTVVAENEFELTARIPEIDVTKIAVGQKADVVFDARSHEIIPASILFISPLAIEIDGVAYFEAKIVFDDPPLWLRGGLNADVDIIVDQKGDALRIPKRFLSGEAGAQYVHIPDGNRTATTAVEIGFVGNDGYVEIIGLTEGDTVVAPQQ